MMKKIVALLVLLSGTLSISAQVKKPTLMILPSDNWCTQRYFTTTYQDIGGTVTVPDYQLAFRQDTELGGVISLVSSISSECKNLIGAIFGATPIWEIRFLLPKSDISKYNNFRVERSDLKYE